MYVLTCTLYLDSDFRSDDEDEIIIDSVIARLEGETIEMRNGGNPENERLGSGVIDTVRVDLVDVEDS